MRVCHVHQGRLYLAARLSGIPRNQPHYPQVLPRLQLEQAAFIIKVHDTEGVLRYDKWR
jgi:hypothetical protein